MQRNNSSSSTATSAVGFSELRRSREYPGLEQLVREGRPLRQIRSRLRRDRTFARLPDLELDALIIRLRRVLARRDGFLGWPQKVLPYSNLQNPYDTFGGIDDSEILDRLTRLPGDRHEAALSNLQLKASRELVDAALKGVDRLVGRLQNNRQAVAPGLRSAFDDAVPAPGTEEDPAKTDPTLDPAALQTKFGQWPKALALLDDHRLMAAIPNLFWAIAHEALAQPDDQAQPREQAVTEPPTKQETADDLDMAA